MAKNTAFYDPEKLISYGATLNFIIGERGVGKSFSMTKFCIKDFLKNGNQFIYLRRYKTELKSAIDSFFSAIIAAGLFEDVELTVKNNKFYINKELAGWAVALSTSAILKSSSFPQVKNIVFDEFILDTGAYHYLPDEVTKTLDIIETVGRLRPIRMFFLGNAVTISNPYFNYFNLDLPYNSEYRTYQQGEIVVNYIKNLEYRKKKKDTKFGKLIAGTEYGQYAIDNEFLRDDNVFVEKKTGNVHAYSTIVLNGKYYGTWKDRRSYLLYISNDYDKNHPFIHAMSISDHNANTVIQNARSDPSFKIIIDSYKNGLLRFEDIKIKNAFMPIIKRCVTM